MGVLRPSASKAIIRAGTCRFHTYSVRWWLWWKKGEKQKLENPWSPCTTCLGYSTPIIPRFHSDGFMKCRKMSWNNSLIKSQELIERANFCLLDSDRTITNFVVYELFKSPPEFTDLQGWDRPMMKIEDKITTAELYTRGTMFAAFPNPYVSLCHSYLPWLEECFDCHILCETATHWLTHKPTHPLNIVLTYRP